MNTWTLEAGRMFLKNGSPAFAIVRKITTDAALSPEETDTVTRLICAFLNQHERRRLTVYYAPYTRAREFVKTGELRAPAEGEWFLSGDLAYTAPCDLRTPFYLLEEIQPRDVNS